MKRENLKAFYQLHRRKWKKTAKNQVQSWEKKAGTEKLSGRLSRGEGHTSDHLKDITKNLLAKLMQDMGDWTPFFYKNIYEAAQSLYRVHSYLQVAQGCIGVGGHNKFK